LQLSSGVLYQKITYRCVLADVIEGENLEKENKKKGKDFLT
jgi:hypothetical protein